MSHHNTHTNLGDEVRGVMFPGAMKIPPRSTDKIKATTERVLEALENGKIQVIKLGQNTWMVPRERIIRVREIITEVHTSKNSEKPTK